MGIILSYSQFLKTYKTRGYRIKHLINYKKYFPIKANKNLAGIIADIMGDGHLQGDPKWRIDYTSKDISELKRFENEIKNLFNIDGKIRKCSRNKYGTYNLAINSSWVSRILFLCGAPSGQKVLKSFQIPKWIKNDKKCFRRFVQRIFTCEGNINYLGKKIPQIRFEMWKHKKLIKDCEKFLISIEKYIYKYFKIKSVVRIQNKENIRKDKLVTQPVRLYILGDSVIRFYHEIGFEGEKQKSLKALLFK